MVANWVSLYGPVVVENGNKIAYNPPVQDQQATAGGAWAFTARAASNIYFDQGSIEFDVHLSTPGVGVQLVLPGNDGDLHIGLNVGGSAYGAASFNSGIWTLRGGAGYGLALPVGRSQVRVEVHGSNIELYYSGVLVLKTSYPTVRGQVGIFFGGNDSASVENVVVNTNAPLCFVVMQFSEQFDALYRDVINPTCMAFNYRVVRADEIDASTAIINDITESIREAKLIIADITPGNPNVYYEVGYAHALQKPTILLSDKTRGKLPFDLSGFRTIFYDNTIGGKSHVEERLKSHLSNLPLGQFPGRTG